MADARSIKRTARRAGILYVVMSVMMVFAFMYIPGKFVVTGDAATTAQRILAGATLYRSGLFVALLSHILFILVVLTLYELFAHVDRRQARLMVVLVCVGVAAEIVNLGNRAAPLLFLNDADSLSVFTQPQREALAFAFLRHAGFIGRYLLFIWGLWLIPFGILTMRSGYFPKFLGVLLFVSGVTYMVSCFTSLILPVQSAALEPILMPFALAEVGMVLWLAIMGAKVPTAREAV